MQLSRKALVFLLENEQVQDIQQVQQVPSTQVVQEPISAKQNEQRFVEKADKALIVKDPLREVITTLLKTKMNQ